jgi:hypothetical protein
MSVQRELVKVTAALEHMEARERAVKDAGAIAVTQVYVAVLRARAAQLRRQIASRRRGRVS